MTQFIEWFLTLDDDGKLGIVCLLIVIYILISGFIGAAIYKAHDSYIYRLKYVYKLDIYNTWSEDITIGATIFFFIYIPFKILELIYNIPSMIMKKVADKHAVKMKLDADFKDQQEEYERDRSK